MIGTTNIILIVSILACVIYITWLHFSLMSRLPKPPKKKSSKRHHEEDDTSLLESETKKEDTDGDSLFNE